MNDDAEKPRRETKAQKLAKVHEQMMRRVDDNWAAEQEVREQALIDRTFSTVRGGMWAGQFAFGNNATDEDGQPVEDGRPRMEINKLGKALKRTRSEMRANRITVDFKPKDVQSNNRDADNLDALFRADFFEHGGQDAVDTCYDEGTNGGFGAWRMRAGYEDEGDPDNDKQRCYFGLIPDADQNVFFDRTAKEYNKSDARWCAVFFTMTREAFKDEYPDAEEVSADSMPVRDGGWSYSWFTGDDIRLVEYYVVEEKNELFRTFRNLATGEEQTFPDLQLTDKVKGGAFESKEEELLATGWDEARSRRIKTKRVRKYLASGSEIIADEGIIAGKHIPIVPFYGLRWFLNGVEWFKGETRDNIDPSRILNFVVSDLAATAASPGQAVPILFADEISGHEQLWARRGSEQLPYLVRNTMLDEEGNILNTGQMPMLQPKEISQATATLMQTAAGFVNDLTGEADQIESVPSNTSDEAIELVHQRSDMRTFIYKDNLAKSMEWCGVVYASIAGDIYVEEGRTITGLAKDGGKQPVTLAQKRIMGGTGDEAGGEYVLNDFTTGTYDVTVDVGPSSKTRAEATVRKMESIAKVAAAGDAELASAAIGTAVMNMDGEDLEGLRKWTRKRGLAAGWVEPNEQEKAEIEAAQANAQPDPQQQLVMAAAAQAKAEAEYAASKSVESQAKAEQARAKTAEIFAGIDEKQQASFREGLKLVIEATQGEHNRSMDQARFMVEGESGA